jgi:hypothetical protein
MKNEEIERILADEEEITPSPGLLTSVMAAVAREAAAPLPLEFPWMCALPGFLATIAACAVSIWFGMDLLSNPAAAAVLDEELRDLVALADGLGLQWVMLAFGITMLCVLLPFKLAGAFERSPGSEITPPARS